MPTIAEEDAKRPNRERECLVNERTRLVNRMKGTLARLGIRNFKPTLRQAAERLATLHTVGRAFGVHRALHGVIFAMLRGPTEAFERRAAFSPRRIYEFGKGR